MKSLIIYDSYFGCTQAIAESIAKNLGNQVQLVRIADYKPEMLNGLELLIIGSPTRGFLPSESIGSFLKTLTKTQLAGIKVAAFDTRIELSTIKSKFLRFIVDKGGYAAKTIAKALKKAGGNLIAEPAGFYVIAEKGPLKEGEIDKARQWISVLIFS